MILKSLIAQLPVPVQDRLRKWHYEKKLRSAQWTDEAELGAVKSMVRPGDRVLDIGANFGLFTRFLSESVGEAGEVFSFEPTRDMFLVLESNCRALGLANVSCQNVALSDAPGRAVLRIPRREDGTLNHYEATLVPVSEGDATSTGVVESSVELQSVDSFLESRGVDRVDFIKCDVEGHEISVLRGAERLIRRCHPAILIEINEPLEDGAHGSEVKALVESLGYTIQVYENGKIRPRAEGETRVNYVLVPAPKPAPKAVPV